MNIQKTIKAKVFGLTNIKNKLITQEYNNYQKLIKSLQTNNPNCIELYSQIGLYSATKQQAIRFIKKSNPKLDKEQPLIIRRDVFKVEKKKRTKITKFWAKIPINGIHGGVWVPIKLANKHRKLLKLSIRETKLIKRNGEWFLHITVQKQVDIKILPNRILSIDLGEKNLAASVELCGNSMRNPKLYGKEARGIRRHFAWLRKKLGRKEKLKAIKKVKNKENRKINDLLHKISTNTIKQATEANAVIVLGDLKGIRNRAKGKRFNRIVSNMTYYKLTQYIGYKALWEGAAVFKLSERGTSKTCHRCGKSGKRPSQGLFKCPSCGLQYNADLNAAINIANRFSDYMLENGVNGSLKRNDLNSPLSKAVKLTLQDPHTFRCG